MNIIEEPSMDAVKKKLVHCQWCSTVRPTSWLSVCQKTKEWMTLNKATNGQVQ